METHALTCLFQFYELKSEIESRIIDYEKAKKKLKKDYDHIVKKKIELDKLKKKVLPEQGKNQISELDTVLVQSAVTSDNDDFAEYNEIMAGSIQSPANYTEEEIVSSENQSDGE